MFSGTSRGVSSPCIIFGVVAAQRPCLSRANVQNTIYRTGTKSSRTLKFRIYFCYPALRRTCKYYGVRTTYLMHVTQSLRRFTVKFWSGAELVTQATCRPFGPAIIGCKVLKMYLKCNAYNKIEMEAKGEQCKICMQNMYATVHIV